MTKDIVEFEDRNYERLVEEFIKKHQEEWYKFVEEEYNDFLRDLDDLIDREIEERIYGKDD